MVGRRRWVVGNGTRINTLFDDYDGIFYIREPTINHYHYALDNSAVLVHHHGTTLPHDHVIDNIQHHFSTVDHHFGEAYYGNNTVRVHNDNGVLIVTPDNGYWTVDGFAVDNADNRGVVLH